MSARRSALKQRRHTCNADRPILESLEERRLLTTLWGGQSFDFKDARDNLFRITLSGNIEAEFVGAAVNQQNNAIRPTHLMPASVDDDVTGFDLFAIYVTRSTPQSSITIVQIDDEGIPTPFGDAPDLNIFSAMTGEVVTVSGAADSGAGYLGARTINLDGTDIDLEEDRPIIAMGLPPTGFGVIPPQPSNILRAGLSVNNGSSLGRFIFDGTVTGFVNITGSIGEFYAGNLFTGDSRGIGAGSIRYADNFNVLGDARTILIKGLVGTAGADTGGEELGLSYWTGVDVQVRGTLGQFRAASDIGAKIDVRNALAGPFLNLPQRESEFRSIAEGLAHPLSFGELGGDEFFFNDTFDTPQYLASIPDVVFGGAPGVRVIGTLGGGDPTDFYGVPLLAGQTVWVQAVSPLGEDMAPLVGVYDPDGRLIASSYNDIDATLTTGKWFQFTADRPGTYRIAVGNLPTNPFDDAAPTVFTPNTGDYSLRVQFVGNVALGGVVSDTGSLLDLGEPSGIKVWRGDFGALVVGESILSSSPAAVDVPFANLRVLEGATLGLNINVPFGHLGLVRSTDGGISFGLDRDAPIGGDIQIIDAAGDVSGTIVTRKGIGIIRAASITAGTDIEVNTDNVGRDGVIGLIDLSGDLGTAGIGPRITTNLGGNVGYVRVGGEVYRDPRFGIGSSKAENTITVPAGQSLTITDDSGTLINIAPRLIPNPRYIPGFVNPEDPADIRSQPYLGKPADFTVTTFPIFGSGGSVITEIISDRSLVISSNNPSRDRRHAEIGRVVFTQGGAPVILEPVLQPGTGTGPDNPPVEIDARPVLDPSVTLDVSLYVQGPTPISILETSFGEGGTLPANMIQNVSGGEMPIILAGSIGNLYGSSIGTARKTDAGTALLPGAEPLLDTYPFIGERVGVVAGDIVNLAATEQIGNVSVTAGGNGIIGAVFPNSDNIDVPDVFEGIVGSIVANEMRYVDIGEGIAAGGTGYDNQAGLFANGQIRLVTNRGRGDIRGPVVSLLKINRIDLTNGSIINANIGVLSSFEEISDFAPLLVLPSQQEPINNPLYELGPITLRGNGGIIGSVFIAHDIDTVHVQGGFGIFNSVFASVGVGRINRIIADGYGLRGLYVTGGGSLTELNATGDGRQLNSEQYSYQVRLSEFGYRVDPFFGIAPNPLTDLHAALGTTKQNRMIDNVTNSGVIEDTLAEGGIDLNAVYAERVRRSVFNFADRIDVFHTRGPIRQVEITTGRLNKMLINGDVAQSLLNVAGPVEDVYITGSVDEQTLVQAVGASGRIGRFQVLKFMGGDIRTSGIINTLAVGRDILATSRIQAEDILTRYLGGQVFGEIVIG